MKRPTQHYSQRATRWKHGRAILNVALRDLSTIHWCGIASLYSSVGLQAPFRVFEFMRARVSEKSPPAQLSSLPIQDGFQAWLLRNVLLSDKSKLSALAKHSSLFSREGTGWMSNVLALVSDSVNGTHLSRSCIEFYEERTKSVEVKAGDGSIVELHFQQPSVSG